MCACTCVTYMCEATRVGSSVCARAHVRTCVRTCVRACVHMRDLHVRSQTRGQLGVCARARAHVRTCARAHVRACVRACARARVRAWTAVLPQSIHSHARQALLFMLSIGPPRSIAIHVRAIVHMCRESPLLNISAVRMPCSVPCSGSFAPTFVC